MDLTVPELLAVPELERVRDEEVVAGEYLQLGPLIPVLGVLHRERMEPELPLEEIELASARILDVHPDPCPVVLEVLAHGLRIARAVLEPPAAVELAADHARERIPAFRSVDSAPRR